MKTAITFLIVNGIFWIFGKIAAIEFGDIVDIVNFGFVVWVFVYDHKKHREEKINDYRMSWYKSFDTAKNLENFRNILDSTEENLTRLSKSLSKKQNRNIRLYTKKSSEEFNRVLVEKRKLKTILSCISSEDGKKIARIFIEFQDELYEFINAGTSHGAIRENEINIMLDGMEQKLTTMLYNTGLRFV